MLFGSERSSYREKFFVVWQKHLTQQPLDALEKNILDIMLMHPEYQHLFQNPEKAQDQDYFQTLGETNPFLHLGLHLTILEQLSLNQPQGITDLYQQSVLRFGEPHQAHHCLMNSLAIGLNELLSNQKPFDEAAYLERIRKAVKDGSW